MMTTSTRTMMKKRTSRGRMTIEIMTITKPNDSKTKFSTKLRTPPSKPQTPPETNTPNKNS